MRVLPDTPVWSAALRRPDGATSVFRAEMLKLVTQGAVEIIGPIRQELLSGVRDHVQFERVRDRLRVFPDLEATTEDYEEAASCYNRCRSNGIQGSSTDFLICAMSIRHDLTIFTTDQDFLSYKRVLPIRLYPTDQTG